MPEGAPVSGSVVRIVLVGFMGAGKSSTGRQVAEALGWRFVDVDAALEAETGMTIPELFERRGELRFRALEDEVSRRLLDEERVVVASGGGWGARPGRLATLPEGTFSVWLDVNADEALRRAARQPGARPLLAVDDPADVARRLLEERTPHYAAADARVDTDGRSVDDVTTRILEILEEHESRTHAE